MNNKHLYRVPLVLVGILLVSVLVLPTLTSFVEGDLRFKAVFAATSPDGNDTLTISKRDSFPVNEWFDPSIVVRVQLNHDSNATFDLELEEESDLIIQPTVNWTEDAVNIPKLSTAQTKSTDILIRRN